VNKTLSKKFIYIITVLALLAMMVPAMAVPVSAANISIVSMTVDDAEGNPVADGSGNEAFNVSGSVVTITASEAANWELSEVTYEPGYGAASWVNTPASGATSVKVRGIWGEARITATAVSDNSTAYVKKKWGPIDHTVISAPGSTYVTWSEDNKSWYAGATINDTVYGNFLVSGSHVILPAQGTILNWYLVAGNEKLNFSEAASQMAPDLKDYVDGLDDAQYTEFVDTAIFDQWDVDSDGWNGTEETTVTGANGQSSVNIGAWFEENVQIVVIPEYPNDMNRVVVPEVTSYNFKTYEMEVVPQVRWAGEKNRPRS